MLTLMLMTMVGAAPTAEESWQLEQVRRWLADERGPGRMAEASEVLPGAKPLPMGSAEYKQAATFVRRGCALSTEPPPELPEGRAWEMDVDGDGTMERLFTGGCSPDPYYEVLRVEDGRWVEWRSGHGRLLDVQRRDGGALVVSATDGYGINRESTLWVQRLVLRSAPPGWSFRVVDAQPRASEPKAGEECVVAKTTKLRALPKVDDAPVESGMGFDWPGNVVQLLAKGSRGWVVGKVKGWKMCAFPARGPGGGADAVKALRTPVVSTVTTETREFVVGWVQGG